jgi:outer membrane protein assembly factor BamA
MASGPGRHRLGRLAELLGPFANKPAELREGCRGYPCQLLSGSWVRIPAVTRILLALLLGCAALLLAQTPKAQTSRARTPKAQARKPSSSVSSSSSRLVSVKATGSKRYSSPQIVAATGLQLGQTVSEDDFKIVSQHLGETGAFSNVAYTFQFSPEGMKLDLQVIDSDQYVPARFDNFVWLSDQELLDKLRASVPLFQGQLPVSGNLADQVSDALQTLAIERHLKGRADYLRSGPADGPMEAFSFSITGQNIRIRQVEFPGAASPELPELEAAAKKLLGEDYVRPALRAQAEKSFLPTYLERGYLKAAFADAQPKIVVDSPEETLVDVAFPVTPGVDYKLSELQLSGDKLFPSEKLRDMIHLPPGQPVNAVKLNQNLAEIKRLYGSRGYMAARISATFETNDSDATVRYLLQFQEGDVYKMGDLEVRGLDSRTTERVAVAWKLREGDTYDALYASKFVESAVSLLPGEDWTIAVHESIEEKNKVVDVSLHFDRKR